MPIQDINVGTAGNDGTGDSARVAGQKINANFQYLENLVNNNSAVENNYNIPPNNTIATMIADQGNQTSGNFQYVADASADPAVTSGGAYYEYLGTTVGDLTDYRKLSYTEAQALQAVSREVKIGGLWYDTVGNTDTNIIEVGNTFRGHPTTDRYVVGKVLDLTNFDIDNKTKAQLFIDN